MTRISKIKMNRYSIIIAFIFLSLSCGGKGGAKTYLEHKGYSVGSSYIIEYESNAGDLREEINALLADLDRSISTSNTKSAISLLNSNDSGEVNNIHLTNLFKLVSQLHVETKGALDPTMSKVYEWYGKEAKKFIYPELIDTSDLDSLSAYTGFNQLGMVNSRIIKKKQEVYLDFQVLIHGYMADQIASLLDKFNVVNYRIEIEGVVVAKGVDADKKNWLIALDKPTDESKRRHLLGTTHINGSGFATAGSYRDFYTRGLMKLPYTLNPTTLYPVKHTLILVSVFASSGLEAEAYANAFLVMGPENTKTFLVSHPELEVYMISANYKGEWQTYLSESLSARLEGVKY